MVTHPSNDDSDETGGMPLMRFNESLYLIPDPCPVIPELYLFLVYLKS